MQNVDEEREIIDNKTYIIGHCSSLKIIYIFSPDYCSSSYNQCFGGWWEEEGDLTGDNPVLTETEKMANGKLLAIQSSQVEEDLSEVKIGTAKHGVEQDDVTGSGKPKLL